MGRIVVLALGGNALTHQGQAGTHEQLVANAEGMARSVSSLMLAGWEVVLVHGNGPQVGNLALQNSGACSPWPCGKCSGPGRRRSSPW